MQYATAGSGAFSVVVRRCRLVPRLVQRAFVKRIRRALGHSQSSSPFGNLSANPQSSMSEYLS